MSSVPGSVKYQLRSLIARFKFDELELAVLPYFPEITWNQLRASLIRHHQNFTTAASVCVIVQAIEDAAVSDSDLKDRLSDLELIEVSRHPARKLWTCYELRGVKSVDEFQSDIEIQKRISQSFVTNAKRMDVRVTSHNSITFVSVKERKKKQSRAKVSPYYFAFSNGHKYFFASRKTITKDYLLALTIGLGYTDNKLAKLSGRDLKSLIELLWIKHQGAVSSTNIAKPPVYTRAKPVISRSGIDFTEYKERGEFVNKCFGIQPPITQSLQVDFVNQTWKCSKLVPEVEGESVHTRWEFHSHNVVGMIKQLVQRRVMRLPLPVYAENLLTTAKNEMILRPSTGDF